MNPEFVLLVDDVPSCLQFNPGFNSFRTIIAAPMMSWVISPWSIFRV
jgi:hypothetical protein